MLKYRRHRNTAFPNEREPAVWFSSEVEPFLDEDMWYIYVMFTEAPGGMGLLKVGVTQDPVKRVRAVRQGSPLPLNAVLFCPAGSKKRALGIEAGIHSLFQERRTRGEWFRFDYSDPIDKQCFHQATKTVYFLFAKRALSWVVMPESMLMGAGET